MCKYDLNEIRRSIREYNTIKILQSGVNDMIDEHLDKGALETLLSAEPEKEEQKNTVNLQQTLDDIEKDKLFEAIINLKNKK